MRGYRPSRFAPPEEFEEDHQLAKDANLKIYAQRAQAGMPLFDAAAAQRKMASSTSEYVGRD